MLRQLTAALLLLLVSCSSSNGGQPGCLPTGPLTPLSVPSDAALAPYLAQLKSDALERWPSVQNLPSLDGLAEFGVEERKLYNWYLVMYPIEQGSAPAVIQNGGGLRLTVFSDPSHDEHAGAATLVEDWLGLPVVFQDTDRTYPVYYLEKTAPYYSPAQLLWLGNHALEKFPTCLLAADVWYGDHGEGGGGGI